MHCSSNSEDNSKTMIVENVNEYACRRAEMEEIRKKNEKGGTMNTFIWRVLMTDLRPAD